MCASKTILRPPVMYTCAIRDYISHTLYCHLVGKLIGNATLLISQIERAHFFKSAETKFTLTRKEHFFRQTCTTCVNKKKSCTTLKFKTSISLMVKAFEGFFYDNTLTYLYSTQNSHFYKVLKSHTDSICYKMRINCNIVFQTFSQMYQNSA